MTKDDYENYLRFIYLQKNGRKLSERSIRHYIDESLRLIDKNMTRISHGQYSSIFDIDSLSELTAIQAAFLADEEFMETDIRGHNMYTAGFNRYLDFARGTNFKGKLEELILLDTPALPRFTSSYVNSKSPKRDRIKVIQIAEACSYRCEVNPNHETFIADATDKPYFEGHHIIPLAQQPDFRYSLDCYANIIILCPTCHRMFHYGRKVDKKDLLAEIYDKRSERYEHAGFHLSIDGFLKVAVDRCRI